MRFPPPGRLDALACAALLLAALLACKGGAKQDAPPPSSATPAAVTTTSPSAAPAAEPPPAWTTVKLDALLGTYKENEVKGDNDYKGKVIRVAGLVGEVKKDAITEQIYVTIGKGGLLEIPVVQCFTAPGEEGAAAALKKGDVIGIEGRVDGLLLNVLVRDCKLNPMMKVCERIAPAISGKCKPIKDQAEGATLDMRPTKDSAILGVILCVQRPDQYARRNEVFKDRTVVGSERKLCFGAFEQITLKGQGPLTDDAMKAKLQAAFDAL